MARPSGAVTFATTPGGIRYQVLLEGYKGQGARDANQEVVRVLVAWDDAEDFLREAVGYTTWTSPATVLDRRVPLQCGLRPGLWCESYELIDCGSYEDRTETNDPFNDNWIIQDWCVYQLVFTRPPYWVRTNATLAASYGNSEKERYVTLSRRYAPRERRKPGFVFETVEATPQVVDEVGFIPDYQIEYVVGWIQVPVQAVPEVKIRNQLLTVNNAAWGARLDLGGWNFLTGELLFKGPQQPVTIYQGADGEFYEDLLYVFTFQKGGWNNYRKNDGTYVALRVRGVVPDTPPYGSSDFDELFKP